MAQSTSVQSALTLSPRELSGFQIKLPFNPWSFVYLEIMFDIQLALTDFDDLDGTLQTDTSYNLNLINNV